MYSFYKWAKGLIEKQLFNKKLENEISNPKSNFFLKSIILLFSFVFSGFAQAPSMSEILQLMTMKFEMLDNYQCRYQTYTARDDQKIEIEFNYYFKKPKFIRCDVVSDELQGSVMIYNQESHPTQIYVKSGSFLTKLFQSIFSKYYFDITDKKVLDLQKHGLHQSDWKWWIDEHIRFLPITESKYIGEETIWDRKTLLYQIISKDPRQTESVKIAYIWVDKENLFPIKYEHYNSKKMLIRKHQYKNLRFNTTLNDSLFVVE